MTVRLLGLEEFDMPDELRKYVADGVFSVQEEARNAERFILSSPQMWLKEGSYVIGISYKTTGNKNFCQLYSAHMMDEEGNIGIVFDTQNLETGEGRAYFYPTFEQDVSNLEIRIFHEDGDLEISEVALRNTKKTTDPLWLYGFGILAVLITAGFLLYWKKTSRYQENLILLIAFWVLMFLTMSPFLNDYLISGHDMKFHMARINGISTGIRNGDFLPRIHSYSCILQHC